MSITKKESLIYGKDIISISDLEKNQILQILAVSTLMQQNLEEKVDMRDVLLGKILATLFFEPSTRTRLSFESAMHRLGGSVTSTPEGGKSSSAVKGESIPDTARTVNSYADVIAVRHPEPGSAKIMAHYAKIPVINAGDGGGEHPTQALLDLYTIKQERGTLDGLKIVIVGDLKHGRTTHSLLRALRFWKVRVILVSPPELKMPADEVESARASGIGIIETEDMESACKQADVVYMTRIQKERFADLGEYARHKGKLVIDSEFMERHPDLTLMHPLPRVDEIAPEVDEYLNAAYFRQAQNGLYVRMAVLALILKKEIDVEDEPSQA